MAVRRADKTEALRIYYEYLKIAENQFEGYLNLLERNLRQKVLAINTKETALLDFHPCFVLQ